MENVIQKYLRNEFDTIEEYNAQAGEVAEPFRILVIANFPGQLLRRGGPAPASASPASGARCGVYTLISVDIEADAAATTSTWPTSKPNAATLVWNDEQRVSPGKDDDFGTLPLTLDAPPPTTQLHRASCSASAQRAKEGQLARRSAVRVRSRRPTASGGPATAAARSTCRSAAPGRRSCSTCGWARAPRSTC